ncbi:MAG: DNA primase [Lachnospiraceae bacterium]|nr:DNA primase [Lachnospiraceae bacterium]
MARYTEEQIEQVRSANDIVDVIGASVRLKRSGSGYVGLCPFHNEKTPSFSVNPARQMYKCFGCGVGGNVLTFVMEYENYTFPEAMEYLADRVGIALPKKEFSAKQREEENLRLTLLEINAKAAKYYYAKLKSPQGKLGYEYLQERGLSDETMRRFGLGYAGQSSGELYRYLQHEGYDDRTLQETGLFKMDERGVYDKFWNRVMFPIMDANNRVIGFGGRVMGDAKPKYLNSPETKVFDKSRNLFGLNYAKQGKRKKLILCEGYMDVIAMHQAGFTGAIASLGTAFTEQQANLLKRYTDEVLITYDSDSAGVKAALRAIPILRRAGLTGKIVHMEPYKDPDEFIKGLGAEAFEERLEKAENSFFFEIDVLQQEHKADDPEERTKFIHEMARKLLVFEDKVQRDSYLEALAAKYTVPKEDLKKLVIRYSSMEPEGYREVMEERRQNSRRQSENSEPDGIQYTYQLFLSWLVEKPEMYTQVKDIIKTEDYLEEPYRQAADLLYGQLENGQCEPAKILNCFEDVEQQRTVSKMFQTGFDATMDRREKEKAINELLFRIKERSIEHKMKNLTDIAQLQELMAEKKALQTHEKLHISLKDG